jgi:general secretion pathway protein G
MKLLKKSKGFTLIELLVVVAIIGVLATIVLSSLSEARARARDAKRLADIKTIQTALEVYNLDNGTYPTTSWASSHNSSWARLEAQLGINLPTDPLNNAISASNSAAASGDYTYGYFGHTSSTYCSGNAYMLVFNLEGRMGNGASDGVTFCDPFFDYWNAFVVGVNRDGSFSTPDTSGTLK